MRQLEYIVSLADTGQFVQTARQCGVSQPALSKQIREVEEMLGVVLFERARPRVLVTEVGEEIVRRAMRVLAEARELTAAAAAWSGPRRGTLRLGVIPTVAPYGLPGLLAKLRRLFAGVTYAIHELQTEVLIEQLRAGAIDLGLLARPFDAQGLAGSDLVVEPFVLVAPKGHPLAARGAVAMRDIVGASLILMQDGHCLRDQAIEVCALAGPPPAASVEAASVSTLIRMVESGLGATLLPAAALRAEVRRGQGMVVRGFDRPPPGRTLTLQWRATSPNVSWYREIADTLQAHYLSLNASMPAVAGQRPEIVKAARQGH